MKFKALIAVLVAMTLVLMVSIYFNEPLKAQNSDPALRNPLFAGIASKYGKDWDKNLHPKLQILLDLQRTVATHALITGYSDEEPNAQYPDPKFRIMITQWDGADLFALGVPKVYNGKPVEFIPMRGFGKLLDESVP